MAKIFHSRRNNKKCQTSRKRDVLVYNVLFAESEDVAWIDKIEERCLFVFSLFISMINFKIPLVCQQT